MDFQTNAAASPNFEDNRLSCELLETPAMDLEDNAHQSSAYEQCSSTAQQLSSHFSMLSFLPPDQSTSTGETRSLSGKASWHLPQYQGALDPENSEINTGICSHSIPTAALAFDLKIISSNPSCPEVFKDSSRLMESSGTAEWDHSNDSHASSPGSFRLSKPKRVASGSELMSMDLDDQSECQTSPIEMKWPLRNEDDHLHIQELLTQLHSLQPCNSNETTIASGLEQLSKGDGELGANFGPESADEKDARDVHSNLQLQPEYPPCPLHIATGRGLLAQERHDKQSVYGPQDTDHQRQRGLLFADADREDLLNLLSYQRVSISELDLETPLARSEAVTGSTHEMSCPSGNVEQGSCAIEVPSHCQCSQGEVCCCTSTGLERLVLGADGKPGWPEEGSPEDPACMSPLSPDLCPMTARVQMPATPVPEELDNRSNDMVESVSFYPALKEVPGPCEPEDLLDGIIFGAKYLGSTQLTSEKNPSTGTRMRQAQEAVDRIKAPEGESQPMTEVDLFVSTQRIKVLTADSQEAMMDHPLQTISYIADIGSIVVLMARRKLPRRAEDAAGEKRLYKMICHVFHSSDAQVIAQAIGQAFSVAYQHFLHSSGIDASKLTPDEFSNVLNQEELYNGDLVHFSKQENCKEICIQKQKGEILGIAIVESGWGSILPTVVIANLMHGGPAEKSGELSIGDRIMSINGTSLVGLPLATCQNIIRDLKPLRDVTLSIVHCPPVTTAIIRRPDSKHQLGFCVEDGIICSLMRGGIAERGGIRVGHRIIEINDQSVVAMAHEKIIQTLMNAIGEVHIKTMPASTYRLLTGQEQPIYL
ncbi:amyloid-beta A4 precursor protein-binding family A member 3 [Ambystoma mexicanum]|uniref:amyloid-beta A4 precursor protein-binding family A member 3 n=1 Tax=Ambystoma mexicanum TaxID=8296 RepID=UPI0037E7E769